MLGNNIENKSEEKGFYKGYKIVKIWSENKGKVLSHTVKYIGYYGEDSIGAYEKLKDLKSYIDSREK